MGSDELGRSEDPEHRKIWPDRKCAVATTACKGNVQIVGPTQLCGSHLLAFDDADWGGRYDRMRAWVLAERRRPAITLVGAASAEVEKAGGP